VNTFSNNKNNTRKNYSNKQTVLTHN